MQQATGTASILSGLLQTGFSQAQSAADRAFTQQGQLADAQKGLGTFLPASTKSRHTNSRCSGWYTTISTTSH